jgi:MoaA/NifB/PqqE/SkfB family radical SAM enzyme
VKAALKYIYYDLPRKLLNGKAFPCRNLVMELTYRCNLSCRMCSIKNEIASRENTKNDVELDKDEVLGIIAQLPRGSNITFTGGEVFLKRGFDEILEKTTMKYNIALASNGVLLEKYSDLLVESGVRAIGISLDGPPEIHDHVRNQEGVFDHLRQGLQALVEAKHKNKSKFPNININSVILRENCSTLPEIVGQVKKLGINTCTFQIFDPSLRRSGVALQDHMKHNKNPLDRVESIDPLLLKTSLQRVLYEGAKNDVKVSFSPPLSLDEIVLYYQKKFNLAGWRCSLPWNTMRISPYGDVYPCLNYSIGNIRVKNLDELWNNNRYVRFRRVLKTNRIFQACVGCCKMFPANPNQLNLLS